MIKYISNGNATIAPLISVLIKKIWLCKMKYFPEPNTRNKSIIKLEIVLFNYTTKCDLKDATGADTSKVAKNIDLAILKRKNYKLGMDELETIPVDLSNLSDKAKNEVFKMAIYDDLVKNINVI